MTRLVVACLLFLVAALLTAICASTCIPMSAHNGIRWNDSSHSWIDGSWWTLHRISDDAILYVDSRPDWYEDADSDGVLERHRTLSIHPHRWLDQLTGEPVRFCVRWTWSVNGGGVTDPACIEVCWPEYCNLNLQTAEECAL